MFGGQIRAHGHASAEDTCSDFIDVVVNCDPAHRLPCVDSRMSRVNSGDRIAQNNEPIQQKKHPSRKTGQGAL